MEIKNRVKLPSLLKHLGLPLIGAEIGVCGGANSADLLYEGLEFIYCIDNWGNIPNVTGDGNYPQEWHDRNYELTLETLAPYEGKYSILKGLSSQMHRFIDDNSLGLVYIDCAHDYNSVKEDIYNYFPKLVKSGIIAFHDFYNEGYSVREAVEEFAQLRGIQINNIPENGDINNMSVWIQI